MIMRLLLSISLILSFSVPLSSQVLINEFSSSNFSGITDEDGDHSDWIELYNHSALEANLAGYHLSDDALNLKKWTLPAISLKPDNFLLIFASGKNRTELPVSFQTIIHKGDVWQYIIPSSEIGNSWKNSGFDASGWNIGPSGFGYGDNDDSTVLNNIKSVFIRKEFVINNLQDISELVLSIDYDDGFVAYINGHEMARSNLGSTGSAVAFNQTASSSREATMYGGGNPINFSISDPANFLVEGVNVIAIQGHNNNSGSSDFSLIPMLSLGLRGAGYTDNLPKYIQLTGKKLHASFKISSEGETLILSRPDSSIIDSVSPIPLVADISYGRKSDGEDTWFYFTSPTPGSSNITDGDTAIASSDTVKFSIGGGYFPGGFELHLSSDDPSDSIFFTLDGSEPSLNDLLYLNPIHISGNTVVRARSVNFRKLPGVVSTNTYITKHHTLPVVILSTNPENLWDYNTGIYAMGPNASSAYPYKGANFWQDWERKAHMEFYDINGVKQIDQDIGIKIFGAYSRGHPQKSLALFARREYGKGSFDYKFFKDKPINKFESIVLRNGGNDWDQAILRDGLTSTLIKDMDIDRMAFQPSIVYINGEYWGILNIREKISTNFIAENHYVNPDNVNLLENNGNTIEGSGTSYLQMTSFLNSNTLETEQNYLQVSNKIDINNYIQYQITQIYINNKDWPGNNIKYWNTNDPGSLWRWIIFDTDFGFSIWDNSAYSFNTLEFALATAGPDWPNPPWSTLLLRRLLTNPGFKKEFVNQYADRINTSFSSERVNAVTDSLKQIYMPEISDHLVRWGLSYSNWQSNFTKINNYANSRPAYARDHMKSVLGLSETLEIKVVINSPGMGRVMVNSVVPEKYPFSGVYFKYLPIKLTAIPAPGYKFEWWEWGSMVSNSRTIDYNMTAACTFKAVFKVAASTDIKIVINEINYNSSPEKDTKDWVELYNAGNTSVNLKNWIISDSGPEAGFTFPSDIILSPGMFIVVCREIAAFRLILPKVKNTTGDMNFGLSSSGDDINLFDPQGNLIDFVNFTPNPPWPTDANGTGASIELINPILDNNAGNNWRSRSDGGTPGERNFLTDVTSPDENSLSGCTLSCFPNPFRDYTTIRVEVIKPGKYKLEIYDLQGRLLKILADQIFEPGPYYIDWGGKNSIKGLLQAGVYIIRFSGVNQVCNLKVVYLE
jgi:hypothetical protein